MSKEGPFCKNDTVFGKSTDVPTAVKWIKKGFIDSSNQGGKDVVSFILPNENNVGLYTSIDVGTTIKCRPENRHEFMVQLTQSIPYSLVGAYSWEPDLHPFLQTYRDKFLPPPPRKVVSAEYAIEHMSKESIHSFDLKLRDEFNEVINSYENTLDTENEEREAFIQSAIELACKEVFSRLTPSNTDWTYKIPYFPNTKYGDKQTRDEVFQGLKRILCAPIDCFEFTVSEIKKDLHEIIVVEIKKMI